MREKFDRADRRLAKLLSHEGREGVNNLAAQLDLSAPTVRSRLKTLIERNLLKIVGVLNVAERPELITAIIGIHANGHGRLDEIAKRMAELPFVTSVSIVTGRYDLIAEVLFEGDMDDLYHVTSTLLPGLAEPGVIQGSETFVVMRSHNKWVSLPKGVWDEDFGDAPGLPDRAASDGRLQRKPSAGTHRHYMTKGVKR
jgi:Lrp/AsnC family transcriptional regulator, regulator for asnA, asnC and gidA